jgi:hypothetical protein
MDRADLEQAVRLATLTPKGRKWVIAYDELAAAQDALEADQR